WTLKRIPCVQEPRPAGFGETGAVIIITIENIFDPGLQRRALPNRSHYTQVHRSVCLRIWQAQRRCRGVSGVLQCEAAFVTESRYAEHALIGTQAGDANELILRKGRQDGNRSVPSTDASEAREVVFDGPVQIAIARVNRQP